MNAEPLSGQMRGHIFWLLGPTSSGKTTIARGATQYLRSADLPIIHFDGDEVRDFFGEDFGFGEENRMRVVEVLVQLANKSAEAGLNVIVSALTAHPEAREYARNNIKNLSMVYIDCPLSICIERDPKGLYKRALNGEIDTLIGYNSKYIEPENPDFVIKTEKATYQNSLTQLVDFIKLI